MSDQFDMRRLAAVMFTDIEGYTSMFQSDESMAMDQINTHRKYIEEVTAKNRGRVIKYYGDGSLTIFDSVIDAIESAAELQSIFLHQKLPVRIGIHLGDLVVKDDDVYGDVVNIASRIQSVGVPGSIVVSKKVIDELANHPEISSVRLGNYELKNIDGRQELYAITGNGLVIPGKPIESPEKKPVSWVVVATIIAVIGIGWYGLGAVSNNRMHKALREEKIAVPPFENFTASIGLNPISLMASHWITTELIELADANVVSFPSSTFYTNTSEASMPIKPQFAKQTGAVNIIKGAFGYTSQSKDSLVFWASIINSKTSEPLAIELEKAYCAADDPLTCIRLMSNAIKGFWKSKNDKVLSPPNYDAYKEYLLARNTWDGLDDSIPESHLREAIRLDPDFLDAYFLLLDLFYNRRTPEEASDTIKAMRLKFIDLTPRQENYLTYHEEDIRGRRVEAFKHFMEEYKIDPKDIFVNTSGMVMALTYLNDPERVIRFHEEIDMDSLDLNTCTYCLERVMMLLQAYATIDQMDKAAAMADKVKVHAVKRDDFHRLIEWYIARGDTASANQLLKKLGTIEIDRDYRYLVFVAGRQAALKSDIALRNFYADWAIRVYGEEPTRALARAFYLKDDFEPAEKIYNAIIKDDPTDQRVYGELGMIYARKEEKQKAEKMIKKLEELKGLFDYGETAYMQGRIKALLGDEDDAIQYLNKALHEGYLFFNSVSFQGDPDLMVLKDNPDYLSLLKQTRKI